MHSPFPRVIALVALLAACTPSAPELSLPLKYHRQQHSLSCEAASLEMVLDLYGFHVTEDDILKKMPIDRTPHAKGVWGDPDQAFVGSVDGEMGTTGYGIHARGLSRVSSVWRKSEIIEHGRAEDVVFHLTHRRPVIIWGYFEDRDAVSWRTPSGRVIAALHDEHTRVVYGFRGEARSPKEFLVMDPNKGPLVWSPSQLLENWDSLGRSALVVYNEAP